MFEDRTYENIRDEMLAEFPDDIDIREGSVAYDSVSAVAAKAAMLYVDIANCYDLTNIEKSSGEYLDRFASEHGLSRIKATSAIYELLFEGTAPLEGDEFYDDSGDHYFTVAIINEAYCLVSQETGTELNSIPYDTPAVPVDNTDGLANSRFGNLITVAIDEETDEALRSRIRDKISGPSENGNRSQYKSWCESVEGVGRAFVNPLKYGPNTVEAILISPQGLPVGDDVVEAVQNYIDPMNPSFTITHNSVRVTLGSGYGDGVANIGAHFVAFSAEACEVSINADVELKEGFTIEQARNDINTVVSAYFKELALYSEDSKTVRYTKIGSLIEQLESVFDYYNLTINGNNQNIIIPDNAVAVLSEVVINVVV